MLFFIDWRLDSGLESDKKIESGPPIVWKKFWNLVERISFLQNALFMTNLLTYKTVTMNVTKQAEARLKKLLPQDAAGFSVTGYVGTCRGSTPVMKPANEPAEGQDTMSGGGITFFVNPDIAGEFRDCELNYDPSLFGKGLTATWPHRSGCACNHG